MVKIALGVEYSGTAYHGWQKQPGLKTIQLELNNALSKLAISDISTICAGRTDAGVHALCQVVHFDTEVVRSQKAWVQGTNRYLPHDITIKWQQEVPDDFHARFEATARDYQYVIYNSPMRSSMYLNQVTWCHQHLRESDMHEASQVLCGKHDFTSFRGSACQAKSPFRMIHHIDVRRCGKFILINIKANAFLHHMVRNIAGVLMDIGAGQKPVSWCSDVLMAKDREKGSKTAAPDGLYLTHVTYPERWQLPQLKNDLIFNSLVEHI